MKNCISIVALIAVGTAVGAQNTEKPKGTFSMLKVGLTCFGFFGQAES